MIPGESLEKALNAGYKGAVLLNVKRKFLSWKSTKQSWQGVVDDKSWELFAKVQKLVYAFIPWNKPLLTGGIIRDSEDQDGLVRSMRHKNIMKMVEKDMLTNWKNESEKKSESREAILPASHGWSLQACWWFERFWWHSVLTEINNALTGSLVTSTDSGKLNSCSLICRTRWKSTLITRWGTGRSYCGFRWSLKTS